MSGGWVNVRGYNTGKRHFHPDATITEKTGQPDQWGRVKVTQTIASPAVCTSAEDLNKSWKTSRGFMRGPDGRDYWGAMSVVESPNLMQRNLCAYCLKIFFRDYRPDLKEAYDSLRLPLRAD